MAQGYQYYRVEQFPRWELGYTFETQYQHTMFGEVDEEPKTIVTTVGLANSAEF